MVGEYLGGKNHSGGVKGRNLPKNAQLDKKPNIADTSRRVARNRKLLLIIKVLIR